MDFKDKLDYNVCIVCEGGNLGNARNWSSPTLVHIVQANDQKKLKKMVEELANKYGKTEDEIFYAYDQ